MVDYAWAMSLGDPSDDVRASAKLSRRGVLRGAAALAGAALLPVRVAQAQQVGAPGVMTARGKVPRNVIFMVADGMGVGTLTLADQYLHVTKGQRSAWRGLLSSAGVRHAMQSTYSDDSLITDSAAASAAWSTGIKHRNGMLCVLPDGRKPEPIMVRAQRSGRAVGCVTTAYVTHATPAGFYCNAEERSGYYAIARQLIERPVTVALGGGAKFFVAKHGTALNKQTPGVRVVRNAAELKSITGASGERLIGLFADDHVPMVLDRDESVPTLEVMSSAALERLSRGSSGFFLQIEAGRVDHAAHANDGCSLLAEQLEFDRTLAMVSAWARDRGDTLVVVTTDHSTGNPSLTWYGREGDRACARLGEAKQSFEWIIDQHRRRRAKGDGPLQHAALMSDLLAQGAGVTPGRDERRALERFYAGETTDIFNARQKLVCLMGAIVANETGVAFLSHEHTGEYVETMAFGTGSETLAGFIDNCELHDWICSVAEIPKLA
jgi:alkaline phosphatase